ncbi:MAG: hypothetical protein H6585_11955 [Flavobacteriales bacterium]|nr:hypothetical protein [Flavobacteriales bacterium]MCB9449044.1 hypothetical protein [Flavobacteriales bacterium]
MKRVSVVCVCALLWLPVLSSRANPIRDTEGAPNRNQVMEIDFCENFKQIIEAAKAGFNAVRGEQTTKKISGADRPYQFCTVELSATYKGYIGMSETHPSYEVFFETETLPKITDKLKKSYEEVVANIKACLPETEWTIVEKDASNDIYLEGTDFKKLQVMQKEVDENGNRIVMEVNMYRHGTENKRVVELKIEGIGVPKGE